jgi:hypothetical protein
MLPSCLQLLAAIGLFSIVISNAQASTWNFAWVGNDEVRYFFDADTVEKNKELVTVWIKTVQTAAPDNDGSWSMALRWRMNCSKRTILSLASSTYDKDGKFLKSSTLPGTDAAVVPDSTGESMLKIACEANFPRDSSGEKYFKLNGIDVFQATRNYVDMRKSQVDSAPK